MREASAEVLAGVPGLSARDVEALRRFFAAIPAASAPSEGELEVENE